MSVVWYMFGAKTIEQFVRDDRNIGLREQGEREVEEYEATYL